MSRMRFHCVIVLIVLSNTALAQQFANTIEFDSLTMKVEKADLSALSWLAGSWKGEAFGGIAEEVWTPPLAGSMMCVYKMAKNDKIVFYEFITIVEEDGTLVKRLRHFDKSLRGWEDKKGRPLEFKFIKAEQNRLYFDGFTYERISDSEINIYAILQQRDGSKQEVKFSYRRLEP